jgi:hypothetical protein
MVESDDIRKRIANFANEHDSFSGEIGLQGALGTGQAGSLRYNLYRRHLGGPVNVPQASSLLRAEVA